MELKLDRTLTEAARRRIRDDILGGQLPSGTRLRLRELADALGMSIMPVREAINSLQAEGLVEQTPHKGATVRLEPVEDFEDLYRIRIRLEREAVFEATRRFQPSDYADIYQCLVNFQEADRASDRASAFLWHEKFHWGIYRLSGSTWLLQAIRPLWDAAERYQRLQVAASNQPTDQWAEHLEILDLCAAGDPDAAGFALEKHLRHTFERAESGTSDPNVSA